MSDLYLHGRKLESIFELLGAQENDITYSLGWVLAHCPVFLAMLLRRVFGDGVDVQDASIHLQESGGGSDGGFTDIEILSPKVHVVVEAKRGWVLPGAKQLELYAPRLAKAKRERKALVVMAECSPEYARLHSLPQRVPDVPVCYLRWKDVHDLARLVKGTHAEKRLSETS